MQKESILELVELVIILPHILQMNQMDIQKKLGWYLDKLTNLLTL